ncbi:hypothetical protein T440DRAFT_53769 [Plenodomus tracheiphilus IPT5]|uniref:Uncharacterized protein n=1 Tax=Plenodomus tracheiphilus IPT5 TaxID=1408161 RepID=A0A6A7B864_9PLEO|nr:hypothetical protein T440DRAFT_53769 [Plenodomus tracheiphilus IPT5]
MRACVVDCAQVPSPRLSALLLLASKASIHIHIHSTGSPLQPSIEEVVGTATMTRTMPSLLLAKVPTCEQAALAIAIVRSKPPHLRVRDYALQLRQHVRLGADPAVGSHSAQYLDLVAYWQDQCQQAQEDCDRLQRLNIKLERSNHMLTARGDPTIGDPDVEVSMSPTRKARAASPVRSKRRPQKRSQERSAQSSTKNTQDTIDNDSDFLDTLGDDGSRLTEALFTTHKLCRASTLESDMLCHSLIRTSSALSSVIRVAARNHEQLTRRGHQNPGAMSLDQDKSDFTTALSVCARAFMSVLIGTSKLASSDADNRMPSLIICELVDMFKCALNTIQSSAYQTAEAVVSQPVQAKKSKPGAVDHRLLNNDSAAARAIAHLLVGFLGLLDRTDQNHQKLFDGFVFVLLERVGQRLYYCTFGHHRSTTIEGNILSLSDTKVAAGTLKNDTATYAVRLELKSLVLILERAMGLAPNYMNLQSGRTPRPADGLTRTLSIKTLATNSRARLSPIAKERLQRTLISCMYGDALEDEFLDVLTKPVPAMRLGALPKTAKMEDQDITEWYKQEVWRLVGWDVLAKNSGWQ